MDPLGLAVIVAVLVVAVTMGLWRRRTDGAIRDEAAQKRRRRTLLEEAGLELAPERDTSSTGKAATAAFAAATAAAHQAAAIHPPPAPASPDLASPDLASPASASPGLASRDLASPDLASPGSASPAPASPGSASPGLASPAPASPGLASLSPVEPDLAAEGSATGSRAAAAGPGELTPDRTEEPGVVELDDDRLDPALLARLGVVAAKATILQFSSAFCAPCRAVRRVSTEVAEVLPGVQHVEVDAESHLDEVRALNIWRTPTLLLLDADGRVVKRATGVPSKPQLAAAVAEILTAEA
jgi:thiol-disulfide isomerase/thioredoxin